jgi:hypothetical protein
MCNSVVVLSPDPDLVDPLLIDFLDPNPYYLWFIKIKNKF